MSDTNFPADGSRESLLKSWGTLSKAERLRRYYRLSEEDKGYLFPRLDSDDQSDLWTGLDKNDRGIALRFLDREALVRLARHWPEDKRHRRLSSLGHELCDDVLKTLEATQGLAIGLIRSNFACLSPDDTVEKAVSYFRDQANRQVRNIFYAYILGEDRELLGLVPFRQLFLGASNRKVSEIMKTDITTVPETATEEEVAKLFADKGLMAFPVVDANGRMKGIVTADNMVSRMQDEATEDIQKLGGMEALEAPYLSIRFPTMVRKRAGWLMVLFVGEMFTATAMGIYEKEIERAVVLALFIPLIISSGGNAGSQATSLIIRAMALQEVRVRDWWRVLLRELASGIALGLILGLTGLLRILIWPTRNTVYGEHYVLIATTVAFSLLGIVLWGSLIGSMLPFVFRRLGFDPASASAPFVATLVDVTGLIIYFTVASVVLGGTLL